MTKVELFSANWCPRCDQAKEDLQAVINELGTEHFDLCLVNVVKNLDRAVKLGVLSTPAIVVEGELVFAAMPSRKKLKATLEKSICTNTS